MTAAAQPPSLPAGQYALAGPAKVRDARVTPIRGDLADIALAGKLFAPHYVVPMERMVGVPFAAVRKASRLDSEQTSELLTGERFMVLDIAGEGSGAFAWGYCAHDSYNGYVALDALAEPKGPAPAAEPGDPVERALAKLGTAYAWGARGGAGIDCSGLIQTSFAAGGIALPRDSDQQEACGDDVAGDPRRGDLAFFPGHVALLTGADEVVHASQSAGRVVVEPLAALVALKGAQPHLRRLT